MTTLPPEETPVDEPGFRDDAHRLVDEIAADLTASIDAARAKAQELATLVQDWIASH